jgi:hypothetical protein
MGTSRTPKGRKPRAVRKPRPPADRVSAERARFWDRIHRQLRAVESPVPKNHAA